MASRLTRSAALAAAILVAVIAAGCGTGATGSRPPRTPEPRPTLSVAAATTLADLTRALGSESLQVTVPQVPYRPAEAPAFAAATRAVVQVVLPNDPTHGYISIYDFGTPADALAAGRAQAAYLATGPGRIQFPPDTRFWLRQAGATVVFYAWSPGSATDELAPGIEAVLKTFGTDIPVPL